ncbi:hypothetical protein [Streptomyces coffeae]|uniref:DUF320 domain-containing protein n=1 Tax=Streptomyces coffeae TaxID=621382 RepID=A0ABS1NN31_9ACTN|nr:hypothetical protein [Streptomyces coffeae]MBL1101495.1 hypothetical protein [Streptomyces coffeae]
MSSASRRRGVNFLVCALVAAGCLSAAPTAVAASAAPAASAVSQRADAVSGSVSIKLTGGATVTIPGSLLSVGTTLNTGVQISVITSVTNNTNATLELSAGGGATVTVAPGATVSVSALGSGSLGITVVA